MCSKGDANSGSAAWRGGAEAIERAPGQAHEQHREDMKSSAAQLTAPRRRVVVRGKMARSAR